MAQPHRERLAKKMGKQLLLESAEKLAALDERKKKISDREKIPETGKGRMIGTTRFGMPIMPAVSGNTFGRCSKTSAREC